MPALEAAQKAHPGTTFVFVNHAESARIVRHFMAVQGLHLQNVVIDGAGQLSARTGSSGFPTTLFYDAGGKLQMRHMGELSAATLADKLSRLNAASPAPPAPPPGHLQSTP